MTDIYKNSEGYNDQTAGKAIVSADMKNPPQNKGEIWTISNPDYTKDPDEWLVIAPQTNGWVTCLEIKDARNRPVPKNDFCIAIGNDRFVDTRNVWSKPSKYFLDRQFNATPEEILAVDSALYKALLLTYIPVDFSTSTINMNDLDIALLKQKAEIYERCFNAIAGRR